MFDSTIARLMRDEFAHRQLFPSYNPPCVAIARTGSYVLGLDDEKSDVDAVCFHMPGDIISVPMVFFEKSTGKKVSILHESCSQFIRGFSGKWYIFLTSEMDIDDIWINPEYESGFRQYYQITRKYSAFLKSLLVSSFAETTERFLNGDFVAFHSIKYAYVYLYIYHKETETGMNMELIRKIKRIKVSTKNDLAEAELAEFQTAVDYLFAKYRKTREELRETAKAMFAETEAIQWTSM